MSFNSYDSVLYDHDKVTFIHPVILINAQWYTKVGLLVFDTSCTVYIHLFGVHNAILQAGANTIVKTTEFLEKICKWGKHNSKNKAFKMASQTPKRAYLVALHCSFEFNASPTKIRPMSTNLVNLTT